MNSTDNATNTSANAPSQTEDHPAVKAPANVARTSPAPRVKKTAAKTAASTAAPAPTVSTKKAPAKRLVKTTPATGVKPAATRSAATTQTTPQAKPTKPAKPVKDKKVKVIRDSFSIPKAELAQFNEMKKRAMGMGVSVKKSELIRAGLQALTSMSDAGFKKALASVPTIKTGRPAKD